MKHIVVLGGGYGGVLTAKKLAKLLKKDKEVKITLIDKKPYHTLLTELHEVAANRVPEQSIRIDLKSIFAGRNVDVVLDEIKDIDFANKKLVSDLRTYTFDYLVIGTGSKPTFFGIPGAEEHAWSLWSYEDAVLLKTQFQLMFKKAAAERDPKTRAEMLTFVVVGAGFTGVEMVGELAEYVDELCERYYIDRDDVHLHVVDMANKILPILPDALIRKAEKRLQKLRVNITTGTQITGVSANGVSLGEQGEIPSRTVIWSAGVEGSELVSNLDVEQQGRKRIATNNKLQALDHEHVYVVGDNIFYIPEGETRPVPQMVENAEQAAPLIAYNIVADIKNKPKKSYKPTFHGTMVCIGSRYGVAYVGTPSKMFKFSGFFAMFIKHFINMVYLFQVSGFNKVYSYLMHEIFHVKHRRSFIGGHLSKRSPNFWLLPLRIYVGYMWLSQGLEKVSTIFNEPSKMFLIPAPVLDGTSGASVDAAAGAAEVWGEALPVPGFIESMVNGSMDLMFYNADGGFTTLAYVFQASMVFAEIIFGAMLIMGLFTALSSIATIGMGLMIWTSGTAPVEMIWYLVGSCALIGGSGSTLGLDYYVLPNLKKAWKKLPFVKRWYLYTN